MKKRRQIISILLSLTMAFGLCGSELAVQNVLAQETQEDATDQEQEENSEDVSDKELAEKEDQEKDKSENTVMEGEKDGEEYKEEETQKELQKELVPKVTETEDDDEDDEGDVDYDNKYTLYYDSIVNDRYYTSSGNFADGETVTMEIEASSEIKDAVITYDWYKAGSKDASIETATKLNVNKDTYTIKKSGEKTEYYICKISDGNETENIVFEIKGNLLQVSKYVNDKPEDDSEEYEYGTKVKLEVKTEKVDSRYQIAYQWRTRKKDEYGDRGQKQDIPGATESIYSAEIDDSFYSPYYCVVTLKEGNEVVQSEEYTFILSAKQTLTVNGAIYVDGKKYTGTEKSVYEGSEVKLEIYAKSSNKNGKIEYDWNLGDNNTTPVNSNSYTFKKDETEWQNFYCLVSDGINTEQVNFHITKASRIKGIRQIDGKNKSAVYCSKPNENHELKVNVTSQPTGNRYEYVWEKYNGIDDSDYDYGQTYEKISGASGADYKIAGDIAGDVTYRCTVKDGTDTKQFKFRIYADTLNCECTVNEKAGRKIQVNPGEKVTLGVKAESIYNNDVITYKWYGSGYDEEGDNDNLKVLGQESTYTFTKSSDKNEEGDYTEWHTCVVSDGFQTSVFKFIADINEGSVGGMALIDGKSYPHSFYDAYIPAVHDKSYRMEVKMISEPKSGEYKYLWRTYNEATGRVRRLSRESECTVKGGLSYENDGADWYVCEVSDGDEKREFTFCLEPYSITADQKINGESVSEVYLPAGKTVELSVDASSGFTSSDNIKYRWSENSYTGIKGSANGNKYTVTKSEDGVQEYACLVEDGYSYEYYHFVLYSDILGVPTYTIDGQAVNELQCAEGTKHMISVDASCSIPDADITYEWSRIDEDGNYTIIANRNKNTLSFTRKGKIETYCCEINAEDVKRSVYFDFSTDGELCRHEFAEEITKATLTQDGSIVKRCTNCGKVDSSELIPYPKVISLSPEKFTYNGKVQTPAVLVTGSDGKRIDASNYTVSYSDGSTEAGTYSATIVFGGNYTGRVTRTYTINAAQSAAPVPAAGTELSDTRTKAVYKVTEAGKSVEYRRTASKKVTSANVPTTVKINNVTYKVTSIAPNAFKNCKKLKKVTIGANIKTIGKQAFSGCKNLKAITVKSKAVKKIGSKAFKGINKKASIKVPKAKLKVYKKLFKKGGLAKSAKVK